jgi:molecular chaperone DnaK
VEVRVDPGWSDTPVRLTREELEAAVADDVERVVATAVDAVAGAGTATEFSAVVLTGGASRMPLVAEYLSDALALPLCAAPDPALTNALGAARLAADRFAPADTAPGNEDRTAPAARRGKARPRREHRPARPGRRSGERAGSPTPGEKAVRPPARVAIVAGLFLLLVVGPSVALTLVGAGPGVATDGTAAAGDKTATDPASTGAGESAAPESTIAGAPRTSNAGHQVVAPSASQTSRNRTSTHRTSSTSTTQARSTSASSKASASPSAPATTAATTAATTSPAASTSTGGTTTGTTTTTNPPTTSAPPPTTTAPPPTTTSDPPPPVVSDPPPVVSSPPAPAPEPPASGGSTGTGTAPGSSDTSTPVSPPATDTTGATA